MLDLEKLGLFYLGRAYDLEAQQLTDQPVLYDAKDLTTHAVCVGMTGSGKTGLGVVVLEEAALDGIPVIAIDPKGDMGNLLLAFPELRGEDFQPWVDPAEAARRDLPVEAYAEQVAGTWRDGLADWGQDGGRIARFREAVDAAIYTPGSRSGIPLGVLRSLDAPPAEIRSDPGLLRDAVATAVSGLLALLGVKADPLRSREHIFLSQVIQARWQSGRSLDLAQLIHAIQSPGFHQVGVLDLESFFPAAERFALATLVNNLLASPSYADWLAGEPLDIQRLFYLPSGKPRLSILSIAHLSEAERMFFVTILLNAILSWLRSQSGTSSLRAILYMDEIFGYFPPIANPPSKAPMLTLLKQARAYGLGIVLATQNPVDLDYKGLANTGTWWLGRLQTQQDKDRVLDGLEGVFSNAGSDFQRSRMDSVLSSLGSRTFLMHNVHEDQAVVFQSRWALSYLRGPLTEQQIAVLMKDRREASRGSAGAPPDQALDAPAEAAPQAQRPLLPPEIPEYFLSAASVATGTPLQYVPCLLGEADIRFYHRKPKVDHRQSWKGMVRAGEQMPDNPWAEPGLPLPEDLQLQDAPAAGIGFTPLPPELARRSTYRSLATSLKNHLFETSRVVVWQCPVLDKVSAPGQAPDAFRQELIQAAREERDRQLEAVRQEYAEREDELRERIRRARHKLAREEVQVEHQALSTVVGIGSALLSMIQGRRGGRRSWWRPISGVRREHLDVQQAEETLEGLEQAQREMDAELREVSSRIRRELRAEELPLEEVSVAPSRSAIHVERVVLVWAPLARQTGERWQPAW